VSAITDIEDAFAAHWSAFGPPVLLVSPPSTRAVLHWSEIAVGIYRRAGFVEQCRLPFHATTAVWSEER
jgi:hypothetical protein